MYRLLKTIKITQIIVEKGIRGRTCHAIHRYAIANNKNIRNHNKDNSHHMLCIGMQDIYMDGAKSYTQPLTILDRHKVTSKFNENFIWSYNENSDKDYIFKVDVKYLKELHELHNDLSLLPE